MCLFKLEGWKGLEASCSGTSLSAAFVTSVAAYLISLGRPANAVTGEDVCAMIEDLWLCDILDGPPECLCEVPPRRARYTLLYNGIDRGTRFFLESFEEG